MEAMTQIIEVIGRAILIALATSFIYYGISTIQKEIKAHRALKRAISSINEINEVLKQI
ncbi:hypothetical protein DSECCO2_414650 [anaerobic digester metagenome]